MVKRKFHLVGIGPLFEDLIIDIHSKRDCEIEYKRGRMRHLCLEAGIKEEAINFIRSTGGSAANIVCMLTRLNDYSLGCFTKLGKGPVSEWLLSDLKDFGVDTGGIIQDGGEVGVSIIITDPVIRDRSIVSYRGVGDKIYFDDIESKAQYLVDAEWHNITSFTYPATIKTLSNLIKLEEENDIRLFFTPSMSMIRPFKKESLEIVRKSDLLSLNDVEAMELSGFDDIFNAVTYLKNLGPDIVFVTLGKKGIIAVDDEGCHKIGTYKVNVKNTVGSGDVCAAVFWDGVYRQLDIESILQRASAAGSIKVQTAGAKKGLPDKRQVDEFLKERGRKPVELIRKS